MKKSPFEVKNENLIYNNETIQNNTLENNTKSGITLNKTNDKEFSSNISKER